MCQHTPLVYEMKAYKRSDFYAFDMHSINQRMYWKYILLLVPLLSVQASSPTDETRRHLLLKCGHLSTNESLTHCFMREMQVIELKDAIQKVVEEEGGEAIVGELQAAKVSYSCAGGSCGKEQTLTPNTVTISSTRPPPELEINPNRYWFNLAHFTHSRIEQADVLFHLNKFRKNYANQTYIVSLTKYGPSNAIAEHFSKIYRFDKIPLVGQDDDYSDEDVRQSDWLNIEVTSYFYDWKRSPLNNHGLQMNVAVQDDHGNVNLIENLRLSNRNIYMEIVNPQREHRRKRQSNQTEDNCSSSCCLHSFEITSNELGFNWIVEPRVFKLNYCMGQCPGNGCCRGEKGLSMEIKYRTRYDGPIKPKNISNVVIQKCVCP